MPQVFSQIQSERRRIGMNAVHARAYKQTADRQSSVYNDEEKTNNPARILFVELHVQKYRHTDKERERERKNTTQHCR